MISFCLCLPFSSLVSPKDTIFFNTSLLWFKPFSFTSSQDVVTNPRCLWFFVVFLTNYRFSSLSLLFWMVRQMSATCSWIFLFKNIHVHVWICSKNIPLLKSTQRDLRHNHLLWIELWFVGVIKLCSLFLSQGVLVSVGDKPKHLSSAKTMRSKPQQGGLGK